MAPCWGCPHPIVASAQWLSDCHTQRLPQRLAVNQQLQMVQMCSDAGRCSAWAQHRMRSSPTPSGSAWRRTTLTQHQLAPRLASPQGGSRAGGVTGVHRQLALDGLISLGKSTGPRGPPREHLLLPSQVPGKRVLPSTCGAQQWQRSSCRRAHGTPLEGAVVGAGGEAEVEGQTGAEGRAGARGGFQEDADGDASGQLLVRAYAEDLPTQAESVAAGVATADAPTTKVLPDLDYLQELIAIQQQGPRSIGFFGTRNMGFLHQQLIEILSYAMIITNNHIFTSGAAGTNAAVIRGALRAERPDLLTVILPQSLGKQPPESQELLQKVSNLVEMPHNDHLPLIEASRLCNMDILSHVQQVICFAFHDSRLLMETCEEAKQLRKIVTLFYLD